MSNLASPGAEYLRAEAWSIRLACSYCSNICRQVGFAVMADNCTWLQIIVTELACSKSVRRRSSRKIHDFDLASKKLV